MRKERRPRKTEAGPGLGPGPGRLLRGLLRGLGGPGLGGGEGAGGAEGGAGPAPGAVAAPNRAGLPVLRAPARSRRNLMSVISWLCIKCFFVFVWRGEVSCFVGLIVFPQLRAWDGFAAFLCLAAFHVLDYA